MPRQMTITKMEDGSALLEVAGAKPVAFSAEEFEALLGAFRSILAPLPPAEMIPPFPPLEGVGGIYEAMQSATLKAGA